MIKPIKISPLNTTKTVYVECPKCQIKSEIYWENRIINTDSEYDMEDILFEQCPSCHSILSETNDLVGLLNRKVEIANLILNALKNDKSNDQELINEYKKIFGDYSKTNNFEKLRRLSTIFHRASKEGSKTDYTEASSINIEGRYFQLSDVILIIERLLSYI